MTDAFCTECGATISGSARFCRACGARREPLDLATAPAPPPPPPPPPLPPVAVYPQAPGPASAATGASILAIAGGLGMLLIALCATVYYPLHYHYSLYYGEPLGVGDVFVFGAAAAAIAIGIRMRRRPTIAGNIDCFILLAAGLPVLVLTVLWAWSATFHISSYPPPFYSGFVYFTQLGQAHIGDGYLQVPLLIASSAVVAAALMRSR